jgi:leucyl-tRNA synthetase
MQNYDPKTIEPKWQKYWEDNKLNAADDKDTKKPKFYCLDMFPYPSGAGLHVGHVESYTATDIYSRFMRMNGYNVLHPQGWDAFGLPAENYAIKTKVHPSITTEKALTNFKRQIKSLGFSYDWSREIKTSDPAYYKWTQWLFIKLYENGLAYQKKAPVNWCESCQTVLAREQVIDGKCERCGKTVIQKNLTQWFFRITNYAEKLLDGLEDLNWPESIKLMQKNWIGKSKGAEIDFKIRSGEINLGKKHSSNKIDKMFEVINQINSTLSKEKIKVWFNGTFGVSGYYGHVFDDPSDVDCGVLVKDFNNARKIIENLGYKKVEDKENPKFKVSIYNAGDFTLEIGTFDHDLGDKIVELEGYEFRVPEPKSFAEGYAITATKKRRIGKNDALRAIFLKSISDDNKVKIFTTRPDTIFGATYLVLAPEHKLIAESRKLIANWDEVEKYIKKTQSKTELERTSLEKVKNGVELKGIKAINPATKKEIPIFIADYVLTTYGTGAIMAVPAHDERDFEFAQKYDLPVEYVVASYIKTDAKPNVTTIKRKMIHAIVLDQNNEKVLCLKWKKEGWGSIIVGGIDNEENALEAAKREIKQESGYTDFEFLVELPGEIHAEYYSSHKKENRYAIIKTLVFKLKNDKVVERYEEDIKNNTKVYWIEKSKVTDFISNSPAQVISWRKYQDKINYILDDGISINSDFINDMPTNMAKNKIVEWLKKEKIGESTVNYRLRDWLVSRQRYWGAPIPIIYCDKCAKKKIKVLVIHGVTGNNNENWFPWLKKQVENSGSEFICPNLPNSNTPTLTEWINHLKKYVNDLDENSIIIGHSLGATAALHLIKNLSKKINKLVLVAPTSKEMGIENFRKKYQNKNYFSKETIDSIDNFIKEKIDWEKIKDNVNESVIYFSKNDPYIDIESKKYFEKNISAKFLIYENKGHFNESYGIKEFPELLNVLNLDRSPGIVTVPEKDLPVKLPEDVNFKPTGESPLARSKEFHDVKCPKCGSPARRESDTMDTFVCSSWYYLRYADPNNSKLIADSCKLAKWLPVDLYIGGKEHATGHLIFSRFMTKVLKDLKYINFNEPFTKLNNQGMIIASDGRKMSKSLGNVINPDDVVNEYGADSLRMYEMFMGPLEDQKPWETKGIVGIKRFLDRVWNLALKLKTQSEKLKSTTQNSKLLNRTIQKVTNNIKDLRFNTAISAMMIFINDVNKDTNISSDDFEKFLLILSPFAPHITEELWSTIGHKESIFKEKWPKATEIKIDRIKIAVQINGKVRGIIEADPDSTEKEILALAQKEKNIVRYLENASIKKSIYVSGKILSIVI